jgi:hypothetical protein
LFNAAGGLSTLQGGTLSPLDPLFEYAKTAPILSLTGNNETENLNFQARPGTNYRLTIGGQVVGSASTPDEVARLVEMANQASAEGGKAVDVRLQEQVQTATPTGAPATAFNDVYANRPNDNGFLDVVIPAALAAMGGIGLAPLLGGGALGVGAGAGLGSIGGSLATGDTLENALIKGAITGVTAGGLSGLSAAAPVVGSKVGSTAAPAIASKVGSTAGSLADDALITVLGSKFAPSIASSVAGAGLGNIGSSLVNDTSLGRLADAYNQPTIAEVQPGLAFDQAMTEGELINVFGRPMGNSVLGSGFGGIAGAFAPAPAPAPVDAVIDPEQTVATQRTDPQGIATELAALGVPAAAVGAYLAAQGAGTGALTASETAAAGGIGGAAPVGAPITAGTAGVAGGSTVSQALAQAPRILGGVGAILGGIGGSGGGTPTAGGIGGGFNETVSFQPLNRTMRPVTFDPFTYGQSGGEFRFFGNEQPQFQTGIGAPAMVAPENPQTPRLARGGPVSGIGGGQDDLIDAKLSDGEYVISAQDVSDLGDGSNQEGARRLDEMRRLIRKGAGRKNTKTIAKPQKSVSSLLRAAR